MPLPESAIASVDQQARITLATVAEARRQWRLMGRDFDRSWRTVGPRIVLLTAAGQLAVARDAADAFPLMVAEMGLPTENAGLADPQAVAGTASDGRDLEGMLYGAVTTSKEAVAAGAPPGQALGRGQAALDMYLQTLMADAAREIGSAMLASHRGVFGYIRVLRPPSCSRCAVLAGKWFGWNRGFQRHPSCDCKHLPCGEEQSPGFVSDPLRAIRNGQVTDLTKAQRAAILDEGADVGQVINASRGMRTADIGGRTVQITTEGTTKAGYARLVRREIEAQRGQLTAWKDYAAGVEGARRPSQLPRLTVGEIYRIGRDREDVIRLLAANGYFTPRAGETVADVARRAL